MADDATHTLPSRQREGHSYPMERDPGKVWFQAWLLHHYSPAPSISPKAHAAANPRHAVTPTGSNHLPTGMWVPHTACAGQGCRRHLLLHITASKPPTTGATFPPQVLCTALFHNTAPLDACVACPLFTCFESSMECHLSPGSWPLLLVLSSFTEHHQLRSCIFLPAYLVSFPLHWNAGSRKAWDCFLFCSVFSTGPIYFSINIKRMSKKNRIIPEQ